MPGGDDSNEYAPSGSASGESISDDASDDRSSDAEDVFQAGTLRASVPAVGGGPRRAPVNKAGGARAPHRAPVRGAAAGGGDRDIVVPAEAASQEAGAAFDGLVPPGEACVTASSRGVEWLVEVGLHPGDAVSHDKERAWVSWANAAPHCIGALPAGKKKRQKKGKACARCQWASQLMGTVSAHLHLTHNGVVDLNDQLGRAPARGGGRLVVPSPCSVAAVLRVWPVELQQRACATLHTLRGPGEVARRLLGPSGAFRQGPGVLGSRLLEVLKDLILDGDVRPFLGRLHEDNQAHMAAFGCDYCPISCLCLALVVLPPRDCLP